MGYIDRITIIHTTVLLYEEENPMPVKYVFVTGGVVSGLGKGITAASSFPEPCTLSSPARYL